jgi:predicted methyltransferase
MPQEHRSFRIILASCMLAASLTAAIAASADPQAASTMPGGSATSTGVDMGAIDRAVGGQWRNPNNVARDKYRHPRETLAFFGIKPNQTVMEITPGAGWYMEILAPLLHDHGRYIGILDDPASVKPEDRAETEDSNDRLEAKIANHPDQFVLTLITTIDPAAPVLGAPGTADEVLTFRNVHNWVMAGTQAAMFKAMFNVLKPGGVLGLTDHRAKPGPATDGTQGYLTEEQVIGYATAAGFVLDAKSEINANPKDTRDYPKGVWTLPPTLTPGEVDKAKYLAIGESDRMTLRFVKPRK